MLPHYQLFTAHWTGAKAEVITFAHASLAAGTALVDISTEFEAVVGVIPDAMARLHFLWSTDPISETRVLIGNIYQYQACVPAKQEALLDLASRVIGRYRRTATHIIIAGDWNASLCPRFF